MFGAAMSTAAPVDGDTGPAVHVEGEAPAVGGRSRHIIVDTRAVGGQFAQIPIPQWNEEWCMEELRVFRQRTSWADFVCWAEGNLATTARQALAVHTTNACQYGKAPGPSGSDLKSCGLENMIADPDPAVGGTSGMAHVELRLPHAFAYGDGLAIKYVSQPVATKKVEGNACIELLCYLVLSAPGRVGFHPSNWQQGAVTIEEFQQKAVTCAQTIGFTPHSLGWQFPEIHAGHPLEAMTLLGDADYIPPPNPWFGGGSHQARKKPAGAGDIDHHAVLEVLRELECDKVYSISGDPRWMPKKVGLSLQALLPRGELLSFLQRYPNFFEVTVTDAVNRKYQPLFSFKVKKPIESGGWKPEPAGSQPAGACTASDSSEWKPWPAWEDVVAEREAASAATAAAAASAAAEAAAEAAAAAGAAAAAAAAATTPVAAVAAPDGPAVPLELLPDDDVRALGATGTQAATLAACGEQDSGSTAPPGMPYTSAAVGAPSTQADTLAAGGGQDSGSTGSAGQPGRHMLHASAAVGARSTQAATLAAGGGQGSSCVPEGPVKQWNVDTMIKYTHAIGLAHRHLQNLIEVNAIDGRFLLQCSIDELIRAGFTELQAKKMTLCLPE